MANEGDGKPDLRSGVNLSDIPEGGILAGRVGDDDILLFRSGDDVTAVGATCTHLGAPLSQGLVDGDRILCPWHHACFDLRTGAALQAPAFEPLTRWEVERRDERIVVSRKSAIPAKLDATADSRVFVIVGGGAAAFAAADELRRVGFGGEIVMICEERDEPYDRTLLTKDYLDGSFGDEELPIGDLKSLNVRFEAEARAVRLDLAAHAVHLADGRVLRYAKLLLATGAEPVRPEVDGIEQPHVHLLRSLADCRAVLRKARAGSRVVVIGGSFIALEAAAALRSRKLDVAIVAQEEAPLARVFGDDVAAEIRRVHVRHGNRFELGRKVQSISASSVTLDDGRTIGCDLVVVGAGVKPRVELARNAGLEVQDGIVVDSLLRTSAPDVFAAGDIACWPDTHSSARIRVEHWVVAQRQGQAAALNMLGKGKPYDDVPFFWTKHFDFSVRYIGHAAEWDRIEIDGDVSKSDASVRYLKDGRFLAEATIGRDLACLEDKLSLAGQQGR